MITIFTIPKGFTGLHDTLQRNAINSWLRLEPKCEIILFGDDPGVGQAAEEFGVRHYPDIKKNEYDTPLVSDAFDKAQEIASCDTLVYVNADIIFFQELTEVIKNFDLSTFLLCGRRWDLNVKQKIDFNDEEKVRELKKRMKSNGELHGPSGLDYFVFKRDLIEMPPFAVGRPGWDSWLIYDMRRNGVPVIDATEVIPVIHQNHDYSHSKFGEEGRVGGPEWEKHVELAGGRTNMLSLRDADWLLTKEGLSKPPILRRIYAQLSHWYLWRLMIGAKRKVKEMMK